MKIKVEAVFVDGEPANLEAAAWDALEWLRLLDVDGIDAQAEIDNNRDALRRAIAALETHLANTEMLFVTRAEYDETQLSAEQQAKRLDDEIEGMDELTGQSAHELLTREEEAAEVYRR